MNIVDGAFRFEARPDDVAVVHRPTKLVWQLVIERSKLMVLRSPKPRRTPGSPPQAKGIVPIRRSAYAFAVAEARRLGMID